MKILSFFCLNLRQLVANGHYDEVQTHIIKTKW